MLIFTVDSFRSENIFFSFVCSAKVLLHDRVNATLKFFNKKDKSLREVYLHTRCTMTYRKKGIIAQSKGLFITRRLVFNPSVGRFGRFWRCRNVKWTVTGDLILSILKYSYLYTKNMCHLLDHKTRPVNMDTCCYN